APVLLIHRAAVRCSCLLDDGPRPLDVVRRAERGQPTVAEATDALQLGRGDAAEPDVRRLLYGLRPDREAPVVEPRAVVVDRVLHPESPDQRERLVEPVRPLTSLDAERLLFPRVRDAEAESGECPTAREAVEARPLLGDEHGVA